jgi:hypothetical protein
MWLRMGKGELRTEFWWGKWKEGDHMEGLGVDRVILKCIFREMGLEVAKRTQEIHDVVKLW